MFLADVYGDRRRSAEGVIPESLASPAHGWSEHGMLARDGFPGPR